MQHTPLEKLERKHFAKGTRSVEKNRVAAVPQEDENSKEIALMEAKMEKLCDLLEEVSLFCLFSFSLLSLSLLFSILDMYNDCIYHNFCLDV